MFKSGRKNKRSDRSSTEEEPRNPKRTNMAANEQEDSGEEDNEEPSLSEIRKMLVDLQSTSAIILECNNKLSSEMAELKNNFESQKRELNAKKVLVEKTMNLNYKLNEDLVLAWKKQAEEITELYNLQDELEQYTRKNSIEICGIPESAYNLTEEAVLKLS